MLKPHLTPTPVPSFNFVNRREIQLTLAALQRLRESGEIDSIETEEFDTLIDAFQTYALSI